MKINPVYVTMVLGFLVLIPVARHYQQRPTEFYGIAEDPDIDLSIEHAAFLRQVLVTEGEAVGAGQSLAILERTNLPYLKASLEQERKRLEAEAQALRQDDRSKRERLEQDRALALFKVDNEIAQLEAEQARNQDLLNEIQNIPLTETTTTDPEVTALQAERQEVTKPYDVQLEQLQKDQQAQLAVIRARLDKIAVELEELQRQGNALTLRAPVRGIIGRIHFVPGEQLRPGEIMLNIYLEHPTQVTTYIPEGLLTDLNLGDVLQVQSIQESDYMIDGTVTSLGNKIRELPVRMRRDPTVQAWGREVRLQIPSANKLMQGERVLVVQSEE